MKQGEVSFLGTRTAIEAWPVLLNLFKEERFNQRAVARRLGVHAVTVYRWRLQNPKFDEKLRDLQKEFLAKEVR